MRCYATFGCMTDDGRRERKRLEYLVHFLTNCKDIHLSWCHLWKHLLLQVRHPITDWPTSPSGWESCLLSSSCSSCPSSHVASWIIARLRKEGRWRRGSWSRMFCTVLTTPTKMSGALKASCCYRKLKLKDAMVGIRHTRLPLRSMKSLSTEPGNSQEIGDQFNSIL